MLLKSDFVLLGLLTCLTSISHGAVAWPDGEGPSAQAPLRFIPERGDAVYPEPPPGPLEYNGTKLVNDEAHPWQHLGHGDMRGPCPGLNTLASHGYLPRDGVVTPAELVYAVMEGLNMENKFAIFATYAAMLVDGNLVTNKLSIGGKTTKTGLEDPEAPPAGGLNTPGLGLEGDASLVHGDAFFGDNHSFNETLWREFVDYSNRFGGGFYNLTVAAELRHRAIQRLITTNPNFTYIGLRYFASFAESSLIINGFLDGRITDSERKVSLDVALGFFRDFRMPPDFYRPATPFSNEGAAEIANAYPIPPGSNVDGVDTYTPDPSSAKLGEFCVLYENFVNGTVKGLYPNPTGVLRRNLILNLGYLYSGVPSVVGCQEVVPYGKIPEGETT